jgi:ABC-type Mn2+/Zn2+ transport system permease subunit/Mn-dependent DtxR family transcriptional regulator
MMEILQQIQLDYGHVIRPLLVGTLVAIVCGTVGCFIVLRRMSFLADAIAHSMLAGVVAGYLLTKAVLGREAHLGAMLLGAIFAGIITVGLVGMVTRLTRLKEDTAIGIMYTGIFALGAFVISLPGVSSWIQIDIYHFIVGSVLAVTDAKLWLLAIVATLVLGGILLFYRSLQLTTFDPVMAVAIGIPVWAVDYMLTACTSLVVVSGVQVVGVILVVALIITPAATAYLLTDRLDRMIMLSALLGVAGFWIGFWTATLAGTSPGASVVVVMTSLFGIAMIMAPRYGLLSRWWNKRNAVSHEILDDVLGVIVRSPTTGVTVQYVSDNCKQPSWQIRRAIEVLIGQEFLHRSRDLVVLTERGRAEASRIVRAHRIWETYLQRTGIPNRELHPKAHVLEHVRDQATIDYLDDKLGHPIVDPHGSEIPIDIRNSEMILSMLREGDRGIVQRTLPAADSFGFTQGQLLSVGPRSQDGKRWMVETESGQRIEMTHDQADAVLVRFAIEKI